MLDLTGSSTIVVGVSGSRASRAALHWAASQAQLLHVPLVTVHAWEPSCHLRAPYAPADTCRTATEDRTRGERLLRAAVAAVRLEHPDTEIRSELVEGASVCVLLACADDALLLALGQGRTEEGEPGELGPVTRDCVRKAHCPVVTVPDPGAEGARRTAEQGRSAPAEADNSRRTVGV